MFAHSTRLGRSLSHPQVKSRTKTIRLVLGWAEPISLVSKVKFGTMAAKWANKLCGVCIVLTNKVNNNMVNASPRWRQRRPTTSLCALFRHQKFQTNITWNEPIQTLPHTAKWQHDNALNAYICRSNLGFGFHDECPSAIGQFVGVCRRASGLKMEYLPCETRQQLVCRLELWISIALYNRRLIQCIWRVRKAQLKGTTSRGSLSIVAINWYQNKHDKHEQDNNSGCLSRVSRMIQVY